MTGLGTVGNRMRGRNRRVMLISVGLVLLATACSQGAVEPPSATRADPANTYDPIRAGEEPPRGYRQLLARDQIAPIYDPVFTATDQVDWPEESLVIGLAGTATAKAYPVTHLNQREMVIDSLEGIPVLVTW